MCFDVITLNLHPLLVTTSRVTNFYSVGQHRNLHLAHQTAARKVERGLEKNEDEWNMKVENKYSCPKWTFFKLFCVLSDQNKSSF